MRIACIGGGPAGLYFSILMKKAFPDVVIDVYERNRPDDTFGWGVVFSAETLGHFRDADAESYDAITGRFTYWDDIETWYGDTCVRSTGHGFCGMSRKRLLQILHARCGELGVALHFEQEIARVEDAGAADLVIACDGINSAIRAQFEHVFRPTLDWRRCKFIWLGTDMPMDAFTFLFHENEHGVFQVHAYPFEPGLGTFIVECREETWRAAGLDEGGEERAIACFEEMFAEHLDGHRLLGSRSFWRTFPTVRNATWCHENVVLLGDAAHTAHFSIGSGTKLAMEDAIALVDAFRAVGTRDVRAALARYEDERWVEVAKLQKAAQTSLEWFENSGRYVRQHPLQFSFNLLCRSKRITWDNLALRDPALVARVRDWWWSSQPDAPAVPAGQAAPVPIFAPLRLRECTLPNRVVVSPMCQYSATDGEVGDWHLVHLGARATGGAGLVMTEMTDVEPEGRITHGCAGLWNDAHEAAWKRIVDFVHDNSPARIGVQLAHAGRKASCSRPWEGDAPLRDGTAWTAFGPSGVPFGPGWPAPRAMTADDMARVRDAFVDATRRAERAGFDLVELHMAHGYLLSSFLSPASNRRTDAYGGALANRLRYPLEVFDAVRAAWPAHKPLLVRVSATDWFDEIDPHKGVTVDETVQIARVLFEHGCDLLDVSSGGNTPESRPDRGRMYQVPFAERVRLEVGMPVMAVGAIQGPDHCNTILAAGRADLCAMARPHLANPAIVLGASETYAAYDQWWPKQYLAAKPRPPKVERRR